MSMASRSRSFASMSIILGRAGTRKPAAHGICTPVENTPWESPATQQVLHEIETLKMRVNIDSRHVLTYALGFIWSKCIGSSASQGRIAAYRTRDSSLVRARFQRSRAGGGPASGQDHCLAGDPQCRLALTWA